MNFEPPKRDHPPNDLYVIGNTETNGKTTVAYPEEEEVTAISFKLKNETIILHETGLDHQNNFPQRNILSTGQS